MYSGQFPFLQKSLQIIIWLSIKNIGKATVFVIAFVAIDNFALIFKRQIAIWFAFACVNTKIVEPILNQWMLSLCLFTQYVFGQWFVFCRLWKFEKKIGIYALYVFDTL